LNKKSPDLGEESLKKKPLLENKAICNNINIISKKQKDTCCSNAIEEISDPESHLKLSKDDHDDMHTILNMVVENGAPENFKVLLES